MSVVGDTNTDSSFSNSVVSRWPSTIVMVRTMKFTEREGDTHSQRRPCHWFISLQNSSQRILSYSGSGWVSHIPSKWWSVCRRVPVVSTVVAFHFHVVHKKLLLTVELVEFPLRCLRFDARMYLQTWIGCFKKWVSSPLLLATAEVYKTTADLVDADKADKSLPAQEKDMYRQNVVVAQHHLLL